MCRGGAGNFQFQVTWGPVRVLYDRRCALDGQMEMRKPRTAVWNQQPTAGSQPGTAGSDGAAAAAAARPNDPLDGHGTSLRGAGVLPPLSRPALDVVGRLLIDMGDGRLGDLELQSRLRTNRALIGDSWAHHVQALHVRFAKTAKYSGVGCTSPPAARSTFRQPAPVVLETVEPQPEPERHPEPAVVRPITDRLAQVQHDGSRIQPTVPRVFSPLACCCRVWNKGSPKQCQSEPEHGGRLCSMHRALVVRYGGWHLGSFDQPRPEVHLYDCTGHIQQGTRIPWEVSEPASALDDSTAGADKSAPLWYLPRSAGVGFDGLGHLHALLSRFDTNGDGSLDEVEQAFLLATVDEGYRDTVKTLLKDLDSNDDGQIDVGEMQQLLNAETDSDSDLEIETAAERTRFGNDSDVEEHSREETVEDQPELGGVQEHQLQATTRHHSSSQHPTSATDGSLPKQHSAHEAEMDRLREVFNKSASVALEPGPSQ